MENEHVIAGLIRTRAELTGQIEHTQTVLRQFIIDLDNFDATLRLFVPDIDLKDIKPKPLPPRNAAFKGEVADCVRGSTGEGADDVSAIGAIRHGGSGIEHC